MKKIFVLTGEPSGDKLASTAISKIQKDNNNIEYLELVDNQNNIKHRDGLPYEALPRYYTKSKR